MTAATEEIAGRGFTTRVWLRRHGWTTGVWLLLVVLVAWYATLIPKFGAFQVTSIIKNSLPLVFLSVGQAVIVIGGGIDLGVGGMMVLGNSTAAQLMDGQSLPVVLLLAVLILAGAATLNGIVGWIINVSKVPDIVITLATGFIYSGLALLILPSPGGGTNGGFRYLFTGSTAGIGTNFWPAVAMMVVPTAAVGLWLIRSRAGLSLYATGSDRNASFLSGVRTFRAKIVAYAVGGAFAGMAGLATTALTGSGDPRFAIGGQAMLNSVAAIVLGGIALTGGVGSVIGAMAAAIVLFTLNPILTAIGVDPNQAQVIKGGLIVGVMAVAGLLELRRRRAE